MSTPAALPAPSPARNAARHRRSCSATHRPGGLTHPLHTRPVGVSQSAMAAADAGLANVLEPATARVTAADRADHSDGCVRVEVRAAAAGSWARPMPQRVTGCVSSASAGAGSRSRYLFLSSRSSNSIPEAESTLKLARHHASRHTILPMSGRVESGTLTIFNCEGY